VSRATARPSGVASQALDTAPSAKPLELLVIGGSTGGPNAITRLLAGLPGDFPIPIAVVVHLPLGFTASFAERLNGELLLHVVEATEGVRLAAGKVVIARGSSHLILKRDHAGLFGALSQEPASLHRPSVDQLFESAAKVVPNRVLAVVLTGMGDDGLAGSRALKQTGSEILVEAESSCVVYGMPRVVHEAGLSAAQFPVDDMARQILARVRG
jgi:two-component system chemotaxis response regulator CheB